jgi:type I restriction enzyme, S subunit
MNEYYKKLGDVIAINPESVGINFPYKNIEYVDISSVGSGTINNVKTVTINDAPSRAKRIVANGDTIISTVRPNRRSFLYIKNPPPNMIVSTGFAVLRPSDKIDSRYLYSVVRNQEFTDYLTNNAKGAAYPAVDTETIHNAQIHLPPLSTQRKIAAILSAYDDLIENNTRRIQILEEMAQMIYRHWFVDFKFPGHEKLRLVDSGTELGMVPEGWSEKNLGYFGEIITGKTPSKNVSTYWNSTDIPFIRTPDMHDQFYCIETTDYLSIEGADSQSNKYLPPNSLCVSCIGTVGIVTITSCEAQTNQQINSIKLFNQSNLEYLYFTLLNLKNTIQSYASTGATMANLSRGKFMALKILAPPKELRVTFHEITSPMFELIKKYQMTNVNLRKSRDLLLPKLIDGELDIGELEIISEEIL